MMLWVFLLIAFISNLSFANVVNRQAADISEEIANEFENPSISSAEQGSGYNVDDHHETAVNHDESHEVEREPALEETVSEEKEVPVDNEEKEQTEESSENDSVQEDQEDGEDVNENKKEIFDEENVEAAIEEESEEPANEEDETEQPAGSEPVEENIETSDSTGEAETLPSTIATDVPSSEKPAEAAASESWVDDFGWTHYPWKKFPIAKQRYRHTKDCGCQIKWIKKVYNRHHEKPIVFLAHSSYVKFPHRHHHNHHGHFPPVHHHYHEHKPCRRHRHHHHVFHRKPIRTVQHVIVNHASKPCFKKPIVNHVTKVHHVRPTKYNGLHAHV